MLACSPGEITVDPPSITIPVDQEPIAKWPLFEDDPYVGRTTLRITYVVTAKRLEPGATIDLSFGYPAYDRSNANVAANDGYLLGPSVCLAQFPLGAFQVSHPEAPGYTTAFASLNGALIELTVDEHAPDGATALRATLKRRALRRGDTITIVFGDRSAGSPGASLSWHPGNMTLVAWEDPEGDGSPTLLDPLPQLLVTGDTPEALRVNLPLTASDSVAFDGTLEVVQGVDAPDRSLLPCRLYEGRIRLEEVDRPSNRRVVTLDAAKRGVVRFNFTFAGTGLRRLKATELLDDGSDGLLIGWSNAVDVRAASAESGLYVGDLHRHAAEGDHAALPAYEVWGLLTDSNFDFGSVIEHSFAHYTGFGRQNDIARRFEQDFDPAEQRFVAFPGYEWSLDGQHRHVISSRFVQVPAVVDQAYRGAEIPPPIEQDVLNDLLGIVRAGPGGAPQIAVPHHMLGDQDGLPAYAWGPLLDDPAQPLAEIYSGHGCSERVFDPPNARSDYVLHFDPSTQRPRSALGSVQDALALGYRLGFCGGSDSHAAANNATFRTQGSSWYYARGGLTIVGGERSIGSLRERIWDGLTKRRTYVTTGARIFVDWHATGSGRRRGAGGELLCREPTLHLRVAPAAVASSRLPKVRSYEIWRDGRVLIEQQTLLPAADELDIEFTDAALPRDGGFHPYYAKVIQDDDHVAWASPIWVKHAR